MLMERQLKISVVHKTFWELMDFKKKNKKNLNPIKPSN